MFLDDEELVLLAEGSPDNGSDLNYHIERYYEEGAQNEKGVPPQADLLYGEGLEDTENVHVEGEAGNECGPEVAPVGGRKWIDSGKD